MLNTQNYGLKKPEGTDVVDIQNFNDNADIIDAKLKEVNTSLSDLVYQTAGGTATTITLTMQTLVTGYAKTFIASANNSGVATTINGKPLYKPGTTTAPTLIAGKAYTVWYNSASLCFFIKASAEGNTIASHVLAGDTFSNDTDTGLVGAMINNGSLNTTLAINGTYTIPLGYTTGGTITQSITTKSAQTYTPSTVNQTIPSNVYTTGIQTILGDAELVSANIKSGINIFGVAGSSTVVDTSVGTAVATDILAGKIAVVDGVTVTGTATAKTAQTYTPSTVNQTLASGLHLTGIQTISGDADLVASNIVSGKSIFNVAGTAPRVLIVSGTTPGISDGATYQVVLGWKPDLLLVRYMSRGSSEGSDTKYWHACYNDWACFSMGKTSGYYGSQGSNNGGGGAGITDIRNATGFTATGGYADSSQPWSYYAVKYS